MATNDFLPFCPNDTGTNLATLSAYALDSNRSNGSQPGVASSKLNNRALRQATYVVGQLAQWISNKLNVNINDDGTPANILGQMYSAFAPNNPAAFENLTFAASVGANALTVALKTSFGSDPSATDVVFASLRSSTPTSGSFVRRSVTAPLSIVIPSFTTLGTVSAVANPIFVYVLDNAGALELAVSLYSGFDQGSLQSTQAVSGASLPSVIYSNAARTNVSVKLVGRLISNQATAGTWVTAPTELSIFPFASSGKQIVIGAPQTALATATGSSFTTPASNNLSVSITPIRTGLFKIWGVITIEGAATGGTAGIRILPTVGTPQILFNYDCAILAAGAVSSEGVTTPYILCNLVVGTAYTFVTQLRANSSACSIRGDQTIGGHALIAQEI